MCSFVIRSLYCVRVCISVLCFCYYCMYRRGILQLSLDSTVAVRVLDFLLFSANVECLLLPRLGEYVRVEIIEDSFAVSRLLFVKF